MKQVTKILACLILITLMVACTDPQIKAYRDSIDQFKEVDISEVNGMIQSKDDFFVYLGRENCPYCQVLVPDLAELAQELGQEIYYVNTLEETPDLDAFFATYNLEYVPSLLYFSQGEAKEIMLNHGYVDTHDHYPMDQVKETMLKAMNP